ncbi:MAG: hypothetical protein ACLT98_08570 [Eggerthellaceae bacterium]
MATLRTLSAGLTARLNHRSEVIAINSALLAAGIGGLITPQTRRCCTTRPRWRSA